MAVTLPNDVVEMTVSRTTNVHNLAVSISKTINSDKTVRLVSIGANAVNQMNKASAKARGFLAPGGKDLFWKVFFTDRFVPAPMLEDLRLAEEEKEPPKNNGHGDMVKVSALVFESRLF